MRHSRCLILLLLSFCLWATPALTASATAPVADAKAAGTEKAAPATVGKKDSAVKAGDADQA